MRKQIADQFRKIWNPDDGSLGGRTVHSGGWKDLTSAVNAGKLPAANIPTLTAFQPGGSERQQQLAFAVNDRIALAPFHVLHDISPNAPAYIHVHWTTDGTDTNTVKWDLEVIYAKGHSQAVFSDGASTVLTGTPTGTAYTHMITETTTPLLLPEPDVLVLVDLKRVTNAGTDNTDAVFGLSVDFHYWSDREVTPQRSPNFYIDEDL